MDREQLIAFEDDLRIRFNAGAIHAPMHLAGGNEAELIAIFENIAPTDWVLGTWRAHYHALLHGVPPEQVRHAIMSGRSIAMSFPEHRFLCSAIVGGIAPLAIGIAAGIKRRGGTAKVWCFLGDMAAHTGIVYECVKYALGYRLPVHWVVENNGQASGVNTEDVWKATPFFPWASYGYDYEMTVPHVGTGVHVRL